MAGAGKYGMSSFPAQSATPLAAAVSNGAMAHGSVHPPVLSAQSPILWIVGIGALTFGFIAVSTSVRIGPLRLSADAGK